MKSGNAQRSGCLTTTMNVRINHSGIEHRPICLRQSTEDMISFSIDKQRDQVNAEWMSRPVGLSQPLVLVLISMEQSPIFAYRLKRKLLSGPIFGEAYNLTENKRFQTNVIVFVETKGLVDFRKELCKRNPTKKIQDISNTNWGTLQMEIQDPFGNLLRFNEPG